MRCAYIFPGQGSQQQGMLHDLAHAYPALLDVFEEASAALNFDVWRLIQENPDHLLDQTAYTQVAMLVSDVAIYRLLQHLQAPVPVMMAGHSLGEYAALVCANSITLSDAAPLVFARGQIMQAHVPQGQGAMAAIVGLSDDAVLHVCKEASDTQHVVTPANYNAIGQVVIAGHTPAVNLAIRLAESAGARLAKIIPVSVPCHCPLLEEAAQVFSEKLDAIAFKKPDMSVIANVDVCEYTSPERIRARLVAQLYSPVRFVEIIQKMAQYPVDVIIECGPGRVLMGLVKRIDRTLRIFSIDDPDTLHVAMAWQNSV